MIRGVPERLVDASIEDDTPERWLPIPGYEGIYEVSDHGRVRSLDRVVQAPQGARRARGRLLAPKVHPIDGYLSVDLYNGVTSRKGKVHQLVLLAFRGPRPEGATLVRHLDGDPANNQLANLAYGTASENGLDQVLHGTHACASKTHCPQGHPYDAENTYLKPGRTNRICRICARAACLRYVRRRRAS